MEDFAQTILNNKYIQKLILQGTSSAKLQYSLLWLTQCKAVPEQYDLIRSLWLTLLTEARALGLRATPQEIEEINHFIKVLELEHIIFIIPG